MLRFFLEGLGCDRQGKWQRREMLEMIACLSNSAEGICAYIELTGDGDGLGPST